MTTPGITIYTGLAAAGKTSRLIDEMQKHQDSGGKVSLFLSSEHEELTKRPNVKPGGKMGCRTPGKSFSIDHVCDTAEASRLLENMEHGAMAVFDEAHFFQPQIADAWKQAATRGINILAGSPSWRQLQKLKKNDYSEINLEVNCHCNKRKATRVVFEVDSKYPRHYCDPCYKKYYQQEIELLLEEVKAAEPSCGEMHTYQPFYDVNMGGWTHVRGDSKARLDIILNAVYRTSQIDALLNDPVMQPTYLDLGCCSGFFTDGMTSRGFRSTGVDVTKHFIAWATRVANLKGQVIQYIQSDALKYLKNKDKQFDVASTFATIQWLMTQQDYNSGVDCFKAFFDKTRYVAIVEMGYTTEDIYKNKIKGQEKEIDREWVLEIMHKHGNFKKIEEHKSGENGIWRDVFVGFREIPAEQTPVMNILNVEGKIASHMSRLRGKVAEKLYRLKNKFTR